MKVVLLKHVLADTEGIPKQQIVEEVAENTFN